MEFASAKVAVAVALAMTFATAALAQTETTLYSFPARGNPDGGVSLSATEPGALYGAAGLTTHGEIFELRQKHSTWKYDTLYKFDGGTGDVPRGPFYQDPEGSLYGTTIFGGSADSGTVFEWNPGGETVLYSFGGGPNDGANPLPGMLHDEATGSFYGMTEYGGPASCGIVFQLTPSAGVWTETVLYAFKGGSDACLPSGSLKMEGNGNLLGVTWSGGSTNGGTVFELSKAGQSWTEKVLYTFPTEFRGAFPVDIDMDTRNGDIYGVAEGLGEARDAGTVFLVRQRNGVWRTKTIYTFTGAPDGQTPSNIKLVGSTIYGTTQYGGTLGFGTIFKLARQKSSKAWQETIVHNFGGAPGDGAAPVSALTADPMTGVLYGVTAEGGLNDRGTVYQFKP